MNERSVFTFAENGALALAAIVFGVMAGFFWTYTFNVNPALLQTDGSTYAVVQSLLNENVRHPTFFSFFFGAGLFSVFAVLLNLRHRKHISFWLIALASAIYILGIIVFTREVNLPLNYYTESWDPSNLPTDWEETREKWNQANAIRVATSFIPFLLCITALLIRSSGQGKRARA